MKFSTQLSDLQKLLQKVMPAISTRAAFEALEHILLSLENNELTAIASDTEITIKSKITVDGNQDGQILIPAKKINDIIKNLDSTKEVHFESNSDDFIIKIISGKEKFQINGMDAGDYLELPELLNTEVPTVAEKNDSVAFFKKEIIQKLANQTCFAVSTDEYRLNMSGVLFQFRQSYVNVVATDSFRLVRSTSFAGENEYPTEIDIIVPVKAIEICKKVDDDLLMSFTTKSDNEKSTHLRMDFGVTVVVTRLINENFPKSESIIPATSNCQAIFDVSELLNGLKRVAPVSNEKNKKCRLEFSTDKLKLIAENEDSAEEATSEIAAELIDAETFLIAFNIKYLEEMVQNITPNDTTNNLVMMHFISSEKAALIKPKSEQESLVMILMPIRTA
jgi:DNA polymerase-3 subunit beta